MATAVEQVDLGSVDGLDVELFADGPPHELYARMRAEAPVRWNETAGGQGFWVLTRHADIAAVSKDLASSWANSLTSLPIRFTAGEREAARA